MINEPEYTEDCKFPLVHYHVQTIVPISSEEANKPFGYKIMLVVGDDIFRGEFAYEKAYQRMNPNRTLIACYKRDC